MRALTILAMLTASCALAPLAMGQTVTLERLGPGSYNKFLVADLGLSGRQGKPNPIFRVQFTGTNPGTNYSLYIEVTDTTGQVLASGTTGSRDGGSIPDSTWINNYEIFGIFGEGDFTVSDSAKRYEDIILATGALPQGTYRINVTLSPGGSAGPITYTIEPPYLQPIYPVDVSSTRDALVFRWVTNIDKNGPVTLRLFTDPQGNNEVQMGGILPQKNVSANSVPGSAVATALADGKTYYWQVFGRITTTHGYEYVRGPLSRFRYFEEAESVQYLGLSDQDKNRIKDELIIILTELVNKRAAKSIAEYELDRAVLDNNVVTRDEIFAILTAIRAKQLKINSIYFRYPAVDHGKETADTQGRYSSPGGVRAASPGRGVRRGRHRLHRRARGNGDRDQARLRRRRGRGDGR
jgi:hypothetical protein